MRRFFLFLLAGYMSIQIFVRRAADQLGLGRLTTALICAAVLSCGVMFVAVLGSARDYRPVVILVATFSLVLTWLLLVLLAPDDEKLETTRAQVSRFRRDDATLRRQQSQASDLLGQPPSPPADNVGDLLGQRPSIAPPQLQPNTKECPMCGETILAIAKKCKYCGELLGPQSGGLAVATASTTGPHLIQARDGRLSFSGPYPVIFELVEQALKDCGVNVKDSSSDRGLVKGKCRYGINLFGITVTATMHAVGAETHAEIAANLSDAFDTFGVCKKKVAQISDRIVEVIQSTSPTVGQVPSSPTVGQVPGAPRYEQRAGVSYRGKALTGMFLSLGGLYFGPAAIVGLIMCGVAITGMATSTNQEGKGFAITGLIIGFLALLGWLALLA